MKKIVNTSHKKSTNRIKNNYNTNGGRDEGGFPRNGAELILNLLVVNVYTTKIVKFVYFIYGFAHFLYAFVLKINPICLNLQTKGIGLEMKKRDKRK